MSGLDDSIQYIKGVGPKRALLFSKLGIFTADELIRFYPRAYRDWSKITKISQSVIGENVCIKAVCIRPVQKFISPRTSLSVFSTTVSDGEDTLEITIFNSRFSAEKLEYGKEYLFFGKAEGNFTQRKMVNPMIEKAGGNPAIRPIYPLTNGLTSNIISKAVQNTLPLISSLPEPFPPKLSETYSLVSEKEALENIHFPKNQQALEAAKKRLVFQELLYLQLGMLGMKSLTKASSSPKLLTDYSRDFEKLLPYKLTAAQERVIEQCISDLKAEAPMSRLVQGDVGSGKTAVALSLMYSMLKNGFQCAMMAPTEILAEQHYKKIKSFLEREGVGVSLLTGSMSAAEKRKVKAAVSDGSAAILIGTHALIQGDVSFKNLGLIIVDEQHRFGVKQRSELARKGENVNTLVMSATPIPRTLALFIYGELDISILDEMPAGRQKTDTLLVDSSYRDRIYKFIKKEIDSGRQAYIVCPLVEDNESELQSAQTYADKLRRTCFAEYSVGLLHGKLKGSEKENIMRRFKDGEIQILVATTVIEVGIDVPNASVMLIENADRYGLSQLHQLRGRIGRGPYKSYCILINDSKSDTSTQRLNILKESADGFEIANADLKLRGPGNFFGEEQHGIPNLKIANFVNDMEILECTGDAARRILRADPTLKSHKYSGLKKGVDKFFSSITTLN